MTTQQESTGVELAVERMDALWASAHYVKAANSIDVDEDELVDDDPDEDLFDETSDLDFDDDWED